MVKRFKLKFRHASGYTWLAKGKAEDVFYYITTEYDGNSASGKDKPASMDVEQITEFWPEIYDFYAQEEVKESWLDAKKIQVKYRKEIKHLKKNNNASGSKKEQELLDAISSILMHKENGRWKDPDWSDMKALELIWDDEWDRLK